jgi:hypothetical protein
MTLAVIGVAALYALFLWLIITIICQYLSNRKGYGERLGLATGLIFPPGVLVWLFMPPKPDSDWDVLGPFGGKKVDESDVVDPKEGTPPPGDPGPSSADPA